MLTAFLIFGFAVVFAAFATFSYFAIALWDDRRERQAKDKQSLAILRANRFLQ